MKALKPLSKTFFSESLINPEEPIKKGPEPSLIDLDEKKNADDDSTVEYVTRSGVGRKWHGGLGQVFRYPGDSKK